MKISGILILAVAGLAAGCAAAKGEPIDLSKACDTANDKKYVEAKGVIAQRGSVFCSNIGGGDVKCGFDLKDMPAGEKKLGVDILEGGGANSVDKLERGYKKEDVKIRDNSGNPIGVDTDVVTVTGKLSVSPDAKACFITVDKIEK